MNENEIRSRLAQLLDSERFTHSLAVQKVAQALARAHHADEQKAGLAGLLHDCARHLKGPELLKKAEQLGFPIHPVEREEPKLLHARLSAYEAEKDYGIKDPEILQAIARHTVGAEDMSKLDKIIFLADHIEPARNYRWARDLRERAFENLDRAVAEGTTAILEYLLERGLPIYPGTVLTRNYYLGIK